MNCSIEKGRGCINTESDENIAKTCKTNSCNKLNVYNWLADLPESATTSDLVEIRFKNTRKAFFQNINKLQLEPGDMVAVEASPGHDIGVVSLVGDLVPLQMRKYNVPFHTEFKKVYRKAKPADVEKWQQAIDREEEIMIRSRQIARRLKLNMKIGDVEFQGDGTKAIFYYIADERVDFRELIKLLADEFRIRVEMRQIGARQEAGRIGGIGSCGRELCCSTWMTNFVSVSTAAARQQELSLNPQKLAGQCGKLKCCLNYELDTYIDAQKDFPNTNIVLDTEAGLAYHQKTDIFKRIMWYSYDRNSMMNTFALSIERVREIMELNKKGKKPEKLSNDNAETLQVPHDFSNVVGQDSLTRFEEKKPEKKRKPPKTKQSKQQTDSPTNTHKRPNPKNNRPKKRNNKNNPNNKTR